MNKKLFVLFVVLILAISLISLVLYDKQVLEKEENNEAIENNKNVTEDINSSEEDVVLGTLKIEKINLNGPIKEGSSSEILKGDIGHIEETSKYDGNVGLAAHNRGNEHSYFARINELEPGDEIKYQTQYGQRIYKVDYKKEILETDWEPLKSSDINKLTLITCIKNKVNQRLCLQATEIK